MSLDWADLAALLRAGRCSLEEFREATSGYAMLGRERIAVEVPRRCGHTDLVALRVDTPPTAMGRELTAHTVCVPCFRAECEARARACADLGLPVLEGTERQVRWANDLRMRAIERHGRDAIRGVVDYEIDATWWIANRARLRHIAVFREITEGAR